MNLTFQRLARPQYVFKGEQRFGNAFQGLRAAGPYSRGDCPNAPQLLFVFPEELKDRANQLFFALKNGVGPFKGSEGLLGFQLSSQQMTRVSPFEVRQHTDEDAARVYQDKIEEFIRQPDRPDIHLAIIIHRKTDRSEHEHNPYLTSKFPLLRANIPTQVVTADLLEHPDLFQWAAANIAVAIFAKMGGEPWAVDSGLSDDSLVVGINRAQVGQSPYYGFASTFAHNGLYLGARLFEPAVGWPGYLNGLRSALTGAINDWRDQMASPVNLIVHVRKEIRADERRVIEDCLRNAGPQLVRAFAVVKLVPAEHMLVTDKGDEAGIPPAGIMIPLASHRAVLQISGQDAAVPVAGKTVNAGPWQITRLQQSPGAPPFDVLCNHVLALSAMNWSGLNTEASPVTIKYPGELAERLGRFVAAGFNVDELRGLSVLKRAWFL
ncbi:MAG: Piwi domain-containing protein [Chloroflexota bacterium]